MILHTYLIWWIPWVDSSLIVGVFRLIILLSITPLNLFLDLFACSYIHLLISSPLWFVAWLIMFLTWLLLPLPLYIPIFLIFVIFVRCGLLITYIKMGIYIWWITCTTKRKFRWVCFIWWAYCVHPHNVPISALLLNEFSPCSVSFSSPIDVALTD